MGMPKERVRGIMERTLINLDYVQGRHTPNGPYEITQLLNSFLGAFIHTKDCWFERIPKTPLNELRSKGWPDVPTDAGYESPKNLRDMIRLMRNGLAHGNIDLLPDENDNISRIRIWNNNLSCAKTWGTELDIKDVERFLRCYIKEMRELDNEENSEA